MFIFLSEEPGCDENEFFLKTRYFQLRNWEWNVFRNLCWKDWSSDHTAASGSCCFSPVLQLSLILSILPKKVYSHCLLLQCLLLAELHLTVTTLLPSHPCWVGSTHSFFSDREYSFSFKQAIFDHDRIWAKQAPSAASQVGIALPHHHVGGGDGSMMTDVPTARGWRALPQAQGVAWAFDGQDCLIAPAPGKPLNHRLPGSDCLGKLVEACPEFFCISRRSSQWLRLDLGGCLQ